MHKLIISIPIWAVTVKTSNGIHTVPICAQIWDHFTFIQISLRSWIVRIGSCTRRATKLKERNGVGSRTRLTWRVPALTNRTTTLPFCELRCHAVFTDDVVWRTGGVEEGEETGPW